MFDTPIKGISAAVRFIRCVEILRSLKASAACGLSGCNTFSRNVVQLSTYTTATVLVEDGEKGIERLEDGGLARFVALSLSVALYKPPSW